MWLPDKQVNGEVNMEVAPQSFTVDSDEGTYRRNRKDIIRLPDPPQHNRSKEATPTTSTSLCRSSRISQPPERLVSELDSRSLGLFIKIQDYIDSLVLIGISHERRARTMRSLARIIIRVRSRA